MGVIMHNNIPYGGGSSIEPNPQESATEQLETLGIDGDVYEVTDANAAREVQATITEAQSRANLADGDSVPTIFGKIKKFFSDLKTVAFTGAYSDLSGTPTIPTVNNGTLTIQKNGSNVATFTANQSGNATANIECAVPSDVEGSKVVTGNPLTITDASPIKAEKIEIGFEPKQDLHGYDKPWVGGAGKNKLNTATVTFGNITFTQDADGYVSASPNNTDNRQWRYSQCQYSGIVLDAGTYNLDWWTTTLSSSTSRDIRMFVSDGTQIFQLGNYAASGTKQFTLPSQMTVGVEAKLYDSVMRLQIRKSTDSNTYEPYTNISPITGYTSLSADDWGKNFLKLNGEEDSLNNITLTPVKDSSGNVIKMHVQGTATANVNRGIGKLVSNLNRRIKFVIDSVPSGISRFYLWDNTTGTMAKDNIVNGTEHTISNDHSYSFAITVPNGNSVNGDIQAMAVNADETDLSFVPYKSITIQLGQTLYGGKLTILQDGSADVYCDRGLINCGSLTYSYDTSATHPFFVANVSSEIKLGASGISSAYINSAVTLANDTNGAFAFLPNSHQVRIRDNAHTDPTEFKTYLTNNNITIVAELATPFTLHLSPVETLTLLQGINNVWTDGTTLSLTYQPDNAIGQAKGTAQDAMAMVNALASTAVKVIAKKGQYEMGVRDWVDMPDCSLSLDKGTYVIIGWLSCNSDMLYYNGNYYRYGCAICDSSNNRLVCNTFLPSTTTEIVYGGTISTFYYEKITSDATVRKLKGYMPYTVSGSKIAYGGIVAIQIA